MSNSAWTDIDKAEQMARDALAGKMRGDLPSWYWPEGTLGLVEEIRGLRSRVKELEAACSELTTANLRLDAQRARQQRHPEPGA